jgi:hypothetical protein
MTLRATFTIKSRAKAISGIGYRSTDGINYFEVSQTGAEEGQLIGAQPGNRRSGSGRSAAHSGIVSAVIGVGASNEHQHQGGNEC